MSANTKAQKIDRILSRQAEADLQLLNIVTLMQLNHETDTQTIVEMAAAIKALTAENLRLVTTNKLLTAVLQSVDAQLNRLRKYVGSVLFKRRQLMALNDARIPTLEPKWGGR